MQHVVAVPAQLAPLPTKLPGLVLLVLKLVQQKSLAWYAGTGINAAQVP